MDDLAIELNIALLPSPELSERLVEVSGEFADRYPAVVRLGDGGRLAIAPHLTLYQVSVPVDTLWRLHKGLHEIALAGRPARLRCTGLAYNAGEASLEAQTDIPGELVELQRAVIDLANPLREGFLLERDPAGNRVADLTRDDGPLGRNIRETGYAEVEELFRPHYTLNWFQLGTVLDAGALERGAGLVGLTSQCPALGLFALGPHGTCPQLLARYEFGG
ncbi:MAG: hypothetical protein J2P26_01550 [Nocardiopsaceae bacterium]|nr:hypothetical protein [Nocardiopsaceae bacterium]